MLAGTRRRRPGADRHRQDRGVRAADPVAASMCSSARRRRWCSCRRASWRSRSPRRSSATPRTCRAFTCCRSTAARATRRSCRACAAACTSWSARRAASWITSSAARSTSSTLKHLVLDEADEMLRMGFIDDVEWILEQAPKRAADRAVLRHDAAADPTHRAEPPAQSRRSHDQAARPAPRARSASATGSSAACTSSMR